MSAECLFWAAKSAVGNPHQKLVLMMLADICNQNRQCWPSHAYLAQRAECSKSTVIRSLNELEKKGLISITHQAEKGMKKPSIYTLNTDVSERHNGVEKPVNLDMSDSNIDMSDRHQGSVTQTPGVVSHRHIDTPINTPKDTPTPCSPPAEQSLELHGAHVADDPKDLFSQFWQAYPRKTNKQAALKAWLKLKPSRDFTDRVCADIAARIASGDWLTQGPDVQFIPHASTYLNNARWEDEIIPRSDSGRDASYDPNRTDAMLRDLYPDDYPDESQQAPALPGAEPWKH